MKTIYNVFRSVVMTLIVLLVVIYLGLYVVLSFPSVQKRVRDEASSRLSVMLGGSLGIKDLSVRPFSEVLLKGVTLDSPEGERCASIGKVGVGIDLWALISEGRIVLNYAEIIGLDADIVQCAENSPLNIQFLIDALSPKDRNKPPAQFDVRIRNIVVRRSEVSFLRPWQKEKGGIDGRLSDIKLTDLRMDLSIPVLRNDMYSIDVRNIKFVASPGVSVRGLSAAVCLRKTSPDGPVDHLSLRDFAVSLPHSNLAVGDLDLNLSRLDEIAAKINGSITPSDLSAIVPQLEMFDTPWDAHLAASIRGKVVEVAALGLNHSESNSSLSLKGSLDGSRGKDSLDVDLQSLDLDLSGRLVSEVLSVIPEVGAKVRRPLLSLGHVHLGLDGRLQDGHTGEVRGSVSSEVGSLDFTLSGNQLKTRRPKLKVSVQGEGVRLDRLLATDRLGIVSAEIEAEVTGVDRNAEGFLRLRSDECVVMGTHVDGIDLELNKTGSDIDLTLEASSGDMSVDLDLNAMLSGSRSRIAAEMDLSGFRPAYFGMKGRMSDCEIDGRLAASTYGDNADNLTGEIMLSDVSMKRTDGKVLRLSELTVSVDSLAMEDNGCRASLSGFPLREIRLKSDWLDGRVSGRIMPSTLVTELKSMIGKVCPTLMRIPPSVGGMEYAQNDFTFDMNIKGVSAPYSFFETPVRPLIDIPVKGRIDTPHGKAAVAVSTPHLQQGKAKLIRDVDLKIDLDSFLGMARLNCGLILPAKKGDAELTADVYAMKDNINVNLGINPTVESVVKGKVAMALSFFRMPAPYKENEDLSVRLDILPSMIAVNDKAWQIASGGLDYNGKRLSIGDIMVSHDNQYVKISGVASDDSEDKVNVRLNDIDLEYIFNILNINYVSFGGMATGEVVGSRLLTKRPEARTEFLHVKGLSYNGAELGNADLASEYDASAQKVGIYAVVRDSLTRQRRASIDGGIWVTRDSLSFGFDADKINVGIMKPFVSAFCSDIHGAASGKCRLYGTFSDIDLIGDLKADTLSMKLDFTNTWYHAGGDSVFLNKGVIDIPPLTLYDDEGHTAEFSGWLRHRYFHDPVFSFRLRDAESLLCYNTNERQNPMWYGTIYGSGHAQINGNPGMIDIEMNMTTEEGTKFYYVISDTEDVAQYSFLTFTDRRKETLATKEEDNEPDYLKKFRKQAAEIESGSSNVILSLKGTVTNDALVTLVMDPRAGDNITARGQGALQMDYNMASNDLRMIGTYVLDEGNYNFTLQDIIIKNFSIRKGSMIKFDGDPMNAVLDIAATYRVNTNLTDLDKSFSTDKELNRTNVPVDAVLLVDGPMTNPDITFDIELPSLTSDVERKVKSIVSTNDMMSRQIIYLLALNRFYTPEYTGGQSNGSEWSSMASSTLSSQLSNILSQMTDKLDVTPSFRSEKGDFSDMEFDLALSSRLLNNRLLINGNFGYRDRSTSNTQFVGDFDIEYLLSKNGNLRLKAYNHFNDQNYYLRSALTTQGVGVVFRRDFDRLFRRRKTDRKNVGNEADTIEDVSEDAMRRMANGIPKEDGDSTKRVNKLDY